MRRTTHFPKAPHPRPVAAATGNRGAKPSTDAVFRELFDDFEIGLANVLPCGQIVYANPSFFAALGGPPRSNPLGLNLRDFIVAESWPSVDSALQQAVLGPVVGEIKVEMLSHRTRTIRLSISSARMMKKPILRVVAREVTELVEANLALRESEVSLRALSARILQVQDQERRKIARDLHDTTGQELAVLVMSLKHLSDSLGRPGLEVRKALVDAADLARKVNEEIRTLSYLLHPPLLDEFGLESALKWYAEGFARRSGIEVNLVIHETLPRFPPEKETALFRVVQESLTNVLRHSGSRKAKIVVCASIDEVELTVEDEGKGIPSATLRHLETGVRSLGVGIPGLRERLRQLGGKIAIISNNRGTKLVATISIAESEAAAMDPSSSAIAENPVPAHPQPGEANGRKRILIVDDHELMRRGIRALLANQADLEICGEAQSGAEAVQKTRDLNPDLLILDLTMPGSGGLSAANHIRHAGSRARILVFTTHSYPGIERMIRSAGCHGLVLKADAGRDLLCGVRAVLAGGEFYGSPSTRAQTA